MASKTISVRLDPQTLARLGAMAEAMDRPRAWLMAHAIRQFVDQEEWLVDAIQAGVDDADAGNTVAHEKVESWVRSWGSDAERERPE